MQTITIAVIAITVSAGMISMPNILNGIRQSSLRADLNHISDAQNYIFGQDGNYVPAANLKNLTNGSEAIKISVSEGTSIGMITLSTGGYVLIGKTKTKPSLVRNSDNAILAAGSLGIYIYKDSRCEYLWQGTTEYGKIKPNQPQDPTNEVTETGIPKCGESIIAVLPAVEPTPIRFDSDSNPAPAGSHWE